MPGIAFDSLNASQGFNFAKDVQEPFGHITLLKIGSDATGGGGVEIKKDIAVKFPGLAEGKTEKVVGIMTKINWNPGSQPGDPIEMTFQVSTANKIFINDLVHKSLESIDCKFTFCIWDYDPLQKKYFKGFSSDSDPLKAQIFKDGKDLKLVSTGTKGEVQAPENWTIELKVVSQPVVNQIQYASGIKAGTTTLIQVVKQWGVEIGA